MAFISTEQQNCIQYNIQPSSQQVPLNSQHGMSHNLSYGQNHSSHQQISYAPPANHKVQVHPIEIISCGNDTLDQCAILSLNIASQQIVYIRDDDHPNKIVPLINNFFSEINGGGVDDLRINKLNLKIGDRTYTQYDYCPPHTISRYGAPVKIPLKLKGDNSQSNSSITLIIWGCYKTSKNTNFKTLNIHGLILDESKKHIVDTTNDDNIWNDAHHLIQTTSSSKDNLISSKSSQNQSDEGW